MYFDLQIYKGSKMIRHKTNADNKSAKEWLYHTKRSVEVFDSIDIEVSEPVFTTTGSKEYMPVEDTKVYTFRDAEDYVDKFN